VIGEAQYMTDKSMALTVHSIKLSVMASGVTAGIIQLIIIRELFAVFHGTEFITGLIMAGWSVFNCLGCVFFHRHIKKSNIRSLLLLQLSLCAAALITWLLSAVSGIFWGGKTYNIPGWLGFTLASLLILLPFCTVDGIHYSTAARLLSGYGDRRLSAASSRIYMYDCFGMVIGFAAASFILIPWLSAANTALFCLLPCLASVVMLSLIMKKAGLKYSIVCFLAIAAIAALMFSGAADKAYNKIIEARLQEETLLKVSDSEYSRLIVSESSGQLNFYMDNQVEGTFPEVNPSVELKAHFPMLCHTNPLKILVAGGILEGILPEVLKHHPERIVYCDLDSKALSIARKYCGEAFVPEDPEIEYYSGDARKLIRSSSKSFDVIILSLPSPASLMHNRYYTKEFFSDTLKALKSDGIFSFSISTPDVYAGKNSTKRNGSIMKALDSVYTTRVVFPGENGIIAASPQEDAFKDIGRNMAERYTAVNIESELLLPEYITRETKAYRLEDAAKAFKYAENTNTNSDYMPAAVLNHIAYSSEMQYPYLQPFFDFLAKLGLWQIIVVILLSALIIGAGNVSASRHIKSDISFTSKAFTAGVSCACTFLCGLAGYTGVTALTYLYQVSEGSIYSELGLLSASILAGYTLGSMIAVRLSAREHPRVPVVLSAVLVLSCLLLLIIYLKADLFGRPLIITAAALWGTLSGMIFPLMNKILDSQQSAGQNTIALSLYGSELAGSAAGSAGTGILFFPVFGFHGTLSLMIIIELVMLLCSGAIFRHIARKIASNKEFEIARGD